MKLQLRVRTPIGSGSLDVELSADTIPVALIGPNGSGKTTLLRIIAGAVRPREGMIRVGDRLLFDSRRQIDVPIEQRRIGYVPQGCGLFPHLRVIDNVAFGLSARRTTSRAERRASAARLLEELGCGHLANRYPARLSGGEQQRVALARALAVDPGVLLLDEPLAALDASARRSMRRFLGDRLREVNKPSIIVTHDVRDVRAMEASVAVLDHGKLLVHADLATLTEAPPNDFVAEFVGS